MKILLQRFFLLTTCLFFLLIFARPALAQTPTPSPRDALIQSIQERAQRDVQLGKAMESVAGLDVLFGKDAVAAGVTMVEVTRVYEDAYKAATPSEPLWKPLLPFITVAGLAAIIALVIQNFLVERFTRFLNRVGEGIYGHVAGYKPFWWIALPRYRRALIEKYQELKIPFRSGRPLKMSEVYVPLKVSGTSDTYLLDALQAIAKYEALVVVGAPGSGKSMLLRHLALTYAEGALADFPTQPIPVLLELNRLNESTAPLTDHLVNVLKQNNFPNADGFVKAGLDHGLLLLLFDGLDEVNSNLREGVANKIIDLLREHPHCRAVVSCRTAVYKDELADWVKQKLEIIEFNDQQIQRFLVAWEQEMPSDKSVEYLLRNLRERPRIMTLARNPLLLTIIAYLYTDTEFVLPHSRAEFYDRSVILLLDQWKEKRNRYKAAHKRLILQRLALFNQDSAVQGEQDRRSIDLPTLLAQIKQVLPSLTLKDEDAQPILDEIVQRSGLILAIDGGVRYQFTHLTLQEFFAALALEADPSGLAERFQTDQDAWRETVKLWCGLTHDSTPLIRAVYASDPLMAFECLGDAQQVDLDFSSEITRVFKERLIQIGNISDAELRAFALVAADPRPRGKDLFKFLEDNLAKPQTCLVAASILSQTNLPRAAVLLVEYAIFDADLYPYLIHMGDLSVPALKSRAEIGEEWAFDALCAIGTPQAALVLALLLWADSSYDPDRSDGFYTSSWRNNVNYYAAWRLATLLPQPNIEAALRAFSLTSKQLTAKQFEWIWEPFNEPPDSSLPTIAGRIAHLLHTAPDLTIPKNMAYKLDERIVIPLCTISAQDDQLARLGTDARQKLVKEVEETLPKISRQDEQSAFVAKYIDQISTSQTWRCLFDNLPLVSQFKLLQRLIQNAPIPTRDDWRNVFNPLKESVAEFG
jgi:hypothetical protein